uniref:Uncharacterized protein n=1 Tax=Nomascus leucogenys TaxID=61853 RepID=A0A2I3H2M9_NOMLE
MCWGYRGSKHLPHAGRTLAPMFTRLRKTCGGQREDSRGMGPHLPRVCACPTSLVTAPWAAAPWQLEVEALSESAQPHRPPDSRGWASGDREDRARLTPQLSP